jgi:hypothetical protein
MAKRMAVGHKYRRGLLLPDNGESRWFKPGEVIPKDQEAKIPGRFLRDKRVMWVEDEPVKKVRSKPTPKAEIAEKSASPSPTSEGVGASALTPLEVTEGKNTGEKKTKRKRKKLFGGE